MYSTHLTLQMGKWRHQGKEIIQGKEMYSGLHSQARGLAIK